MTPQEVLTHPPKVLTQAQRKSYFDAGYIVLPGFVDGEWLRRIHEVTAEFVEKSRDVTQSNAMFSVEPDHSAKAPRLRRLSFPVGLHDLYREFAFEGPIVDVAEDLLGPNVCYHHSKLNFKWSDGGEEVKWHQDIHYWPHTDFAPLTIGVYLDAVDEEMGPMGVVPGSHHGPLYNLQDDDGNWVAAIQPADLPGAHVERADYLMGPAGTVTVHNCCAVHGSAPNRSPRGRPMLLNTYTAGDSFPLQTIGTNGLGGYANTVVRGRRPEVFEIMGRTLPVAPDYSGGYSSLFDIQQEKMATTDGS